MTLALDREALSESASATAPAATVQPAADVDELVRTHLPLVGHLVREVLSRVPAHVSRDDLVSAGMYALTVTAQSFDASLGVPFARFAAIRIRGALTDELRSMDWASRAVRGRARELNAVRADLTHTIGREPTRPEIAQAMGLSAGELATIEADVQRAGIMSLQALSPEDGAESLPVAGPGPEAMLLHREQLGYLRDAVAELPDKLRRVVEEYFFGQRKMIDIAADLGVTESRVSQLRSEALLLLRAAMNSVDNTASSDTPARGRAAASRQAYCSAVAARSTVSGRLAATTVLGEVRGSRRAGRLRVAN